MRRRAEDLIREGCRENGVTEKTDSNSVEVWYFAIKDEFGGTLTFGYTPRPMLQKLSENFDQAPEPSDSEIVSSAKEYGLTPDEAIAKARKAHSWLVAEYSNYAAQVLYKELPLMFKETLDALADRVWLRTVFDQHDKWKEKALLLPTESRTVVTNRFFNIYNKRAKKYMSTPGPGQHSQWTKDELERVVRGAIALLPNTRDRTYSRVAQILKDFYGDKAPKSGEALRKLLNRFGLDWKKLKTGQY